MRALPLATTAGIARAASKRPLITNGRFCFLARPTFPPAPPSALFPPRRKRKGPPLRPALLTIATAAQADRARTLGSAAHRRQRGASSSLRSAQRVRLPGSLNQDPLPPPAGQTGSVQHLCSTSVSDLQRLMFTSCLHFICSQMKTQLALPPWSAFATNFLSTSPPAIASFPPPFLHFIQRIFPFHPSIVIYPLFLSLPLRNQPSHQPNALPLIPCHPAPPLS